MPRINVYLNEKSLAALRALAERELRDPRAQAAFIIRHELVHAGLLTSPVVDQVTSETKGSEVPNAHPSG